jgi:two-component system chemotaxis sensor kinase CheA
MSAFAESQDLLQDFLAEAGELLSDVDIKLVELEQRPDDADLINVVFRGFHTIKGGAGFLDAGPLVELCHKTENLFDLLRSGKLSLSAELLDIVLEATGEVRRMFDEMAGMSMPEPAPRQLIEALRVAAEGGVVATPPPAPIATVVPQRAASAEPPLQPSKAPAKAAGPDWPTFYAAVTGRPLAKPDPAPAPGPAGEAAPPMIVQAPAAPRVAVAAVKPAPTAPRAAPSGPQKETTLRIDTTRFDQILNLSGEIGLTRTRLACLAQALTGSQRDNEAAKALEAATGELDMLVGDLQSAVMKARMQPVGRVFQKYIRLARDLGRQLGKDIELELLGEETEVDKTILEELNDPLVHLVRNSVDHGVESPAERLAAGKPAKSTVRLSAAQAGDQIVIEITDDGKGMRAETIREKAVEKGLLTADEAALLDARQSLNLIFLPGFSTKAEVSDVSGRGVGMDVVKTNISRLKGRIDIASTPGKGTKMTITLPLTLAILPVLMLKLGGQPFAIPLGAVREVIETSRERLQYVSGRPAIVVRGEVLPIIDLGDALARGTGKQGAYGVVVNNGDARVILGVDEVSGQAEVMIKPLAGMKPHGVAGATLSGEGVLVLVLDLNELLEGKT